MDYHHWLRIHDSWLGAKVAAAGIANVSASWLAAATVEVESCGGSGDCFEMIPFAIGDGS